MMQIDCPFCGRRDETEFTYGGEPIARPDVSADDPLWAEYLFFRNNTRGVHTERWRHTGGCGQWFFALRNTATHHFAGTFRLGEPLPETPASVPP